MKSITRHMTVQIIVAAIVASLVLCAAIVLQQSVRFIDLIVNRGLPFSDFAYLAVLVAPRFFAVLFPIAVFGAAVFTYNRMQIGSELVVLRGAGMSSFALARPGLTTGLVACVVSYAFTLYLAPLSAQDLRSYITKARSEIGSLLIKPGQFNDLRDDLTVYVKNTAPNGDLLGLVVHNTQPSGDTVTVIAERGSIVDTDTGARLLLSNGNQQTQGDGDIISVWFDAYTFDLHERDDSALITYREPKERFLSELLEPGDSPADIKNRSKLIAEGHNRLAQPLLSLSYVGVALLLLLKTEFNRQGQTMTVIMAIFSMVAILAANLTLVSASSKSGLFIPVLYIAAIGPFVVSVILLLVPSKHRGTSNLTLSETVPTQGGGVAA